MLGQVFKKRFGISPALAAANLVLVAGSFVWYYLAFNVLLTLTGAFENVPSASLIILGVNIGAIAVAAVVGSLIGGTHRRESGPSSMDVWRHFHFSNPSSIRTLNNIRTRDSLYLIWSLFRAGNAGYNGLFCSLNNP